MYIVTQRNKQIGLVKDRRSPSTDQTPGYNRVCRPIARMRIATLNEHYLKLAIHSLNVFSCLSTVLGGTEERHVVVAANPLARENHVDFADSRAFSVILALGANGGNFDR